MLRIDPARFDFVAGTMLIHATADLRRQPPQIDLSLHADDVQLGEFLRAMGRTAPFTGELALILKLESQGDLPAQLVSSLDGEAQFALQRGGVDLGSLNLATADVLTWLLAGAERGTGVLRGITASGRTTLECFAGRFVVARRHRDRPVAADEDATDDLHGHRDPRSRRPDDRSSGASERDGEGACSIPRRSTGSADR